MTLTKTFVKSKKAYKVKFSLPKTIEGNDIRLLGEFNDWNWESAPSLKKTKDAYKVEVLLEPGKAYEYRYCVDQSTWLNDGIADSYTFIPNYSIDNCVVDLLNIVEETPVKKVAKKPVAKKVVAKKPAAKKATTKKIDLTLIEGVGPKISGLLTAAGFSTFAKVAKAKPEALKKVLTAAGKRYTMHDPTTWPVQAKLIADGKLDQLKKLQDELKGGKKAK